MLQKVLGSQVLMVHALILALGRQRQADLCEFEAGLVYRVSSRTVRAAQIHLISKNNKNKTKTNQTKVSFLVSSYT